jgi:hypothetical protein
MSEGAEEELPCFVSFHSLTRIRLECLMTW